MKRALIVALMAAFLFSSAPVTTFAAPASAELAAPNADVSYEVLGGDTLWSIAVKFGVSVSSIKQANGLTSDFINPGQILVIPGVSGPSSGAAPAAAPAAAVTTTTTTPAGTYTVKPGDTLWNIAFTHGVTVQAVRDANGLTSNIIYTGNVLNIPGGTTTTTTAAPAAAPVTTTTTTTAAGSYTVKANDTLWSIAFNNGTTVSAIQQANGLTNNIIFIGQTLTIPGLTVEVPVAQAGPTAAPVVQPTPNLGPSPMPPAALTAQAAALGVPAAQPTAVPAAAPTAAPSAPVASNIPSGFNLGGQLEGHMNDQAKDALNRSGMTWVKHQVRWHPGKSAQDEAGRLAATKAAGFKVLLSTLGHASDAKPEHFAEYARFVGELAKMGADAIEIWNEMNLPREWQEGQIDPVQYTEMLRQSYATIKASNPNTIVVSGALAPTGFFGSRSGPNGYDDLPYTQGMVAAGALNYMDCMGIHYNEGIISPTLASGDPRGSHYTRYYRGMIDTYWSVIGGQRPLCMTEIGYLTGEGYGGIPAGFAWASNTTLAQHAQWSAEAVQLAASEGKTLLHIVWNVDIKHWSDDPQAGFAMIRPDGSCPACASIGAVMGR